jgi:hypothetical protein
VGPPAVLLFPIVPQQLTLLWSGPWLEPCLHPACSLPALQGTLGIFLLLSLLLSTLDCLSHCVWLTCACFLPGPPNGGVSLSAFPLLQSLPLPYPLSMGSSIIPWAVLTCCLLSFLPSLLRRVLRHWPLFLCLFTFSSTQPFSKYLEALCQVLGIQMKIKWAPTSQSSYSGRSETTCA